jgi:hypothetical protein
MQILGTVCEPPDFFDIFHVFGEHLKLHLSDFDYKMLSAFPMLSKYLLPMLVANRK